MSIIFLFPHQPITHCKIDLEQSVVYRQARTTFVVEFVEYVVISNIVNH